MGGPRLRKIVKSLAHSPSTSLLKFFARPRVELLISLALVAVVIATNHERVNWLLVAAEVVGFLILLLVLLIVALKLGLGSTRR